MCKKIILLFLSISFSFACGCVDPHVGPAASQSVKSAFDSSDREVSNTIIQIAELLKEAYTFKDARARKMEGFTRLQYNNVVLYQKGTISQLELNRIIIKH